MDKLNPKHYEKMTLEMIPWDVCELFNYNIGCALKYLYRVGKKEGENPLTDLGKANKYLQRELNRIEKGYKSPDVEVPMCMYPTVSNTPSLVIIYILSGDYARANSILEEYISSLQSDTDEPKKTTFEDTHIELNELFKKLRNILGDDD